MAQAGATILAGRISAALPPASRVKLAANPGTPPMLLACLAEDGAVTVRAAVALNPAVPDAAERQLAHDTDERVRILLARKLASALPGLSAPDQAGLRDRTVAILADLVQDETVRIRETIAQCLASMETVPHDLVLSLARDSAISVSEPILRVSPLLSAEDLLALLAEPPHAMASTAIACRADLPDCVSDAIARGTHSPAICALLANPSASIREDTLDALMERAAGEPLWHAPLVRRPALPDHVATALSEIVCTALLEELAARCDLSPGTVQELRTKLRGTANRAGTAAPQGTNDTALLQEMRLLEERGDLTEATLLEAFRDGDLRRASAVLAVAGGVGLELVDRAAALRSAKGLISLVWKAGFSMRAALAAQAMLGKIAPSAMLGGAAHGASAMGAFPLSVDEMGWQLDFLSGQAR